MTQYTRGRAFEYLIRNKLRDLDFFVVRSAQSKGPVDLVAIRRGLTLFVQCKRDMRIGPAEWNELWEVAERTGSVPVVVGVPSRRVVWRRIVGPKTARGKQPWTDFDPRPPVPISGHFLLPLRPNADAQQIGQGLQSSSTRRATSRSRAQSIIRHSK